MAPPPRSSSRLQRAAAAPNVVDPIQDWPPRPAIERLVLAGRAGDRALFDQLFEECFADVYALAWQATRDVRRAQEMTEEILIAAVLDPR